MVDERSKGLFLKGRDAGVQLVSTGRVGVAWPNRSAEVWSCQRHVIHAGHHAPHVHKRLVRHGVGRGIDEPYFRWQRQRDPYETVLAKIAEIAGVVAVGPEIIRIDRPKQRIVGIRIPLAPPLKQSKSRLDAGGRELKTMRRHVAVGARAPVRAQTLQRPIEERAPSSLHSAAGLASAVELRTSRFGEGVPAGRHGGDLGSTGSDHQRQTDHETARNQP